MKKLNKRRSGILLHITSLPSSHGIGDCGPQAYKFVDFLHRSKQSIWQILPVNPTDPASFFSPYSSISVFAGNPLFISLELLQKEGYLKKGATVPFSQFNSSSVQYDKVNSFKMNILKKYLFVQVLKKELQKDFNKFRTDMSDWLEDYSLFMICKEVYKNTIWSLWPEEIKNRDPRALEKMRERFRQDIEHCQWVQYIFYRQWMNLKAHCRKKSVSIWGDIPIYVHFDSADVWSHPHLFKLDNNKNPFYVSGVPPDYFSRTGQRWGTPVYDWKELKNTRYDWWVRRIRYSLKLFDNIRIDHFRGFVAYWEIPASEKTAVYGKWVKVPGKDFFKVLKRKIKNLPIIAEDIGYITPAVNRLMKKFNFPGMKVLQFAFGNELKKNLYLPHNYQANCVVYTGTHDNNTIKGWYEKEASSKEKKNVLDYLGIKVFKKDVPKKMIELAMRSKANSTIIPMQDWLELGQESRMNKPATTKGNWQWRLLATQITPALIKRIRKVTKNSQRT